MSKPPKDHIAIGRLALREEGTLWNAYFAPADTMVGARLLGSILVVAVSDPAIKQAFMDLMRSVMSFAIREATGVSAVWGDPEVAPESERGGHG